MSQIAGFVIFWSLILSVTALPIEPTPVQIDQNIQLQETRVPEAFPNYFLPSGSNEFTNLHLQNRESIGGLGLNSTTTASNQNQNQTELLNCTRSLDPNCTEPKRDKERRLEEIRQRVALLFPGRNVPTVSSSSSSGQLIPSSTPVGKIQTFYAQCDLPKLSDASTWNSEEFFHIFFNVSSAFPHTSQVVDEENRAQTTPASPSTSTTKNIFGIPERQPSKYKDLKIRATLKLYKIGFGRNAEEVKYESPEPSKICTDTRQGQEIQINSQDSQSFVTVSNSGNSAGDDERIRISVFWYTQHLTSHHYKRKLLDSKSFLAKESKWIEFDISKAARTWIERNNNNGLVIEVENENEELLDAKQYVSDNYACHALKLSSSKNNSRIDFLHPQKILPPPMLEVCTIEKPISDDDDTTILTFPFPSSILTSPRDEQPIVQGDGEIDVDLGSFTTARSRQHRHGHGGNLRRNQRHNKRNRNSNSTSGSSDNSSSASDGPGNGFKLDENHPLRSILFASNPNAQNAQNQQVVNNERGDFSSIRRTPPGGVKGGQAFDLEAFKTLIREVNSQNQNQLRNNGTNDGQIVIQRIFINPEKLFPSISTTTTPAPSSLNEIKSDGKSL